MTTRLPHDLFFLFSHGEVSPLPLPAPPPLAEPPALAPVWPEAWILPSWLPAVPDFVFGVPDAPRVVALVEAERSPPPSAAPQADVILPPEPVPFEPLPPDSGNANPPPRSEPIPEPMEQGAMPSALQHESLWIG